MCQVDSESIAKSFLDLCLERVVHRMADRLSFLNAAELRIGVSNCANDLSSPDCGCAA